MASGMYSKTLKLFADGDIDYLVDTINATLVDAADYTVLLNTDDFYDDVPTAARATNGTGALASKTTAVVTATLTIDAGDLTLVAVTGDPSQAVVIYKGTGGADSTDPLIAYLELTAPVTPNGGNITLQWHANGLMQWVRQ